MWKRLRNLKDGLYNRLFETFMLLMMRIDPRPMQHAKDEASMVDWRPASAHRCSNCPWTWMMWDAFVEQWACPRCGTSRYPSLSVTEKRLVVRLPAPASPVIEPPVQGVMKPVFRTGQLSFLHRREAITNSTERLPNGLPRLAWQNGERIDSGQLKPLTPREKELLMNIFREDRRTG